MKKLGIFMPTGLYLMSPLFSQNIANAEISNWNIISSTDGSGGGGIHPPVAESAGSATRSLPTGDLVNAGGSNRIGRVSLTLSVSCANIDTSEAICRYSLYREDTEPDDTTPTSDRLWLAGESTMAGACSATGNVVLTNVTCSNVGKVKEARCNDCMVLRLTCWKSSTGEFFNIDDTDPNSDPILKFSCGVNTT